VISGLFLIRTAWRRSRRREAARSLALGEPVPSEIHALGPPIACHQVNPRLRQIMLTVAFLCFIAGVACAGLAISGRARGKMYFIAVAAPICGLVQMRRALRTPNLRILVLRDGLVAWHGRRMEILRWDDLAAVFVKKDPESTPHAQLCSYTLERLDGSRFEFHANIEFFENQLGVRVQYELCRRLLTRFQALLQVGRSIDFGPFQVGARGITLGAELLGWDDLGGVKVEKERLIVSRGDGRPGFWADLVIVRNLAVFVLLAFAVKTRRPIAKCDSGF
jgi:hypothetical protein